MKQNSRLVMLNQMAGPLFRELAEGLAPCFSEGALLFTGHPDTLSKSYNPSGNLKTLSAPGYDRRSKLRRVFSWLRYLIASTRLILGSRKSDLFLLVSNPPIMGGWFLLLNKILKRPYAVLVYDLHPDVWVTIGVLGVNSPIVWFWHHMNKMVYRDAKVVITLGKYMAHRIRENYKSCDLKIEVIPPWADSHFIKPLSYSSNPLSKEFNPEGKNVVLYSGNMGISHDIDSMLEAARFLSFRKDILFLFIGAGACWKNVLKFKKKYALTNLEVYSFQVEERLPYTMALATVSMVALDDGAEGLMIPSKVFYYLAAGSAVIGICKGENELRDIIEGAECGVCVPPNSPKHLANEIVSIIDDKNKVTSYRENARAAAVSHYSREEGVNRFISVFSKIGWIDLDPNKGICK